MKELGSDDPDKVRRAGAIDLPTMQKYLNFWFSSSLDLFGAEISSNAATYFATGIKGRPDEGNFADHLCNEGAMALEMPDGKGGTTTEQVPLRNAMNEATRTAYVRDCEIGVKRWNRLITKAGHAFALSLPSPRFRRSIGAWAWPAGRSRGQDHPGRRMAGEAARLAPLRERPRLHQEPDAARHRARQDGRLDRTPRPRHQQPAARLRVCASALGCALHGQLASFDRLRMRKLTVSRRVMMQCSV